MHRPRFLAFPVIIIVTLLVQLATPGIAWADGEAPPAQPEAAAEAPTEPLPTVGEILTDAPAGTELLVVDATGTPEPLVTQQAAEAIAESDPIWCDAAPTPTCTPPQLSVTALLAVLAADPSTYHGDGTIYFTTDYAIDDAYISGAGLGALQRLTIDAQNNTLSVPLEVTGWAYDVRVVDLNMDLTAYPTATNALRVETTGTIRLTHVDITGSNGGGAFLDNSSGTGSITVTSSMFSGNTWTGLDARSDGDITLTSVVANGQEDGAYLDASSGSGNIDVDGSDFSANTLAGLTARTADGDITLTNVTASTNTSPPTGSTALTLSSPSIVGYASEPAYGIGLTSTSGGAIQVTTSSALQNEGKGLWIEGTGPVNLQGVTASNNGLHGAYIHNLGACAATPIGVTVNSGTFQNNGGYGILAVLGPAGTFTLAGSPVFAGNLLGDYAVNLDPCPECEKTGEGKPFNIIYVPETGGPPVPLDCAQYAGTVLILPNGDRATLVCPVTGETTLSSVPSTGLPAPLPAPRTFVSGVSTGLTKDGQPVLTITEGGYLTVAFAIPDELRNTSLTILYWDPIANGGAGGWVELPAYAVRPDGSPIVHRLHPDITPGDGMLILGGVRVKGDTAMVDVNFAGIFVLVSR